MMLYDLLYKLDKKLNFTTVAEKDSAKKTHSSEKQRHYHLDEIVKSGWSL